MQTLLTGVCILFLNLIGVVALSPLVMKITRNYIDRHIRKKDVAPILSYDPAIQKEAAEELNAQ